MTKEETIKRIGDIRRIYERMIEIMTENEIKAFDMVVEALKQEPCEDAISRKSVLDFIKECSLGGWVELPEEQWNEFVLSLPSVNSQESILEKIRSEVEQYNLQPSNYPCNMISIGTVLQIIDKYRGEEDEDSN